MDVDGKEEGEDVLKEEQIGSGETWKVAR